MVLIRIHLKLIKCDFSLDFILFHFIKEVINFFFLMASYLLFWKFFGDIIHEKFKKKKKKQKNAQKTSLSSAATWITFLAYRELNFFSKNINSKSIGILSSKLWPKYETGAEYNTNSALSSIFSQNFKWGSTSNLFKPI